MGIIERMRKQKAVWWEFTGLDRSGQKTYANPIEIQCRWEDVNEESIDERGNQFISASIVYVDREMKPGDILWNGLLADDPDDPLASAPADPRKDFNARQIRAFERMPKLDYSEVLLTAKL